MSGRRQVAAAVRTHGYTHSVTPGARTPCLSCCSMLRCPSHWHLNPSCWSCFFLPALSSPTPWLRTLPAYGPLLHFPSLLDGAAIEMATSYAPRTQTRINSRTTGACQRARAPRAWDRRGTRPRDTWTSSTCASACARPVRRISLRRTGGGRGRRRGRRRRADDSDSLAFFGRPKLRSTPAMARPRRSHEATSRRPSVPGRLRRARRSFHGPSSNGRRPSRLASSRTRARLATQFQNHLRWVRGTVIGRTRAEFLQLRARRRPCGGRRVDASIRSIRTRRSEASSPDAHMQL